MSELWRAVGLLWPLLVLVIGWSSLIALVEAAFSRPGYRIKIKSFYSSIPLLLAFSALGVIIGYVSGLSREPVIGAVIPALLSLVAAIGVLVVGKQPDAQVVVGKMILALSVMFVFGISVGSYRRENVNMMQQQAKLDVFLNIDFQRELAIREALIRRMRQKLDLPTAPIEVHQPTFSEDPKNEDK